MVHQAGADPVEVHVARHRPEVGLVLDQLGPIATQEDMPAEPMAPRSGVGIGGEEGLYAAGQVGLGRFENHMEMVGQDDEGVYVPGTAERGPTEIGSQTVAVGVVSDYVLPAVAAGHEVVEGARTLDAGWSWYALHESICDVGGQGKN